MYSAACFCAAVSYVSFHVFTVMSVHIVFVGLYCHVVLKVPADVVPEDGNGMQWETIFIFGLKANLHFAERLTGF